MKDGQVVTAGFTSSSMSHKTFQTILTMLDSEVAEAKRVEETSGNLEPQAQDLSKHRTESGSNDTPRNGFAFWRESCDAEHLS